MSHTVPSVPVDGHRRPAAAQPEALTDRGLHAPSAMFSLAEPIRRYLHALGAVSAERLARIALRKLRGLSKRCAPGLSELYYSRRYAREYQGRIFAYEPLISLIMPVYNTPQKLLAKLMQSVRRQKYTRWEFCIANNGSTEPHVRPYLEQMQSRDLRLKVTTLEQNQHISGGTNAAMRLATGEYFLFVDSDDLLFTPWALTAFVDALQEQRYDLLYADHVMIDERGAVSSYAAKPDWEVDFLLSTHYIAHPLMCSRHLIEAVGEFRHECSGAQDIDLCNRAIALSPKTKHIRKYLYGWRMLPGSVTVSSDAKPTIIPRSLLAYNDRLGDRQSFAQAIWPSYFEARRVGAFKVQFSRLERFVHALALVIVDNGDVGDGVPVEKYKKLVPYPVSDVLVLSQHERRAAPARQDGPGCHVLQGNSLAEALSRATADYVLFLDASIETGNAAAVDELLGYLLLDPQVGVVAGKVLDHEYRIACSSYVFQQELRMFGEGHLDGEYHGYWFKNRLAHNALAVPGSFCATRRQLLVEHGLDVATFGEYAVPDYCLRLGEHAFRTVYNPWAVCVSPEICLPPPNGRAYEAFRNRYCQLFGNDPFYTGYHWTRGRAQPALTRRAA